MHFLSLTCSRGLPVLEGECCRAFVLSVFVFLFIGFLVRFPIRRCPRFRLDRRTGLKTCYSLATIECSVVWFILRKCIRRDLILVIGLNFGVK